MSNENQNPNESFPDMFDTGPADALAEKLADAMTPGYVVECDPVEADRAGAFAEDAMSEADALASGIDLNRSTE